MIVLRYSDQKMDLSEGACGGKSIALHHLLKAIAVNRGCYKLITTFASCLQNTSQCSICLAVIR